MSNLIESFLSDTSNKYIISINKSGQVVRIIDNRANLLRIIKNEQFSGFFVEPQVIHLDLITNPIIDLNHFVSDNFLGD